MELHVRTRRDLCPDPGFDSICAIFYHMTCETDNSKETGMFIIDADSCPESDGNEQHTTAKDTKSESGERF